MKIVYAGTMPELCRNMKSMKNMKIEYARAMLIYAGTMPAPMARTAP